ncbi:virulence factor TspB C-terminal domain-related protein [Acinetobacter guillouiae]|uniref:virulence factor TspB C-terminal domain-related protein n=1 Tax=Acinetobacter guillouiae TaxID=106649 RepID=UPI003AF455F0
MKKFITVLLSFVLYFNVFSQAHAGAEKWVVEKVAYESVAKVVNVTAKRAVPTVANNPSYLARVPVTASATGSTVAAMIRMGIAGAAIYGLVQGVGWIIENGVVKKPVDSQVVDPSVEYVWIPINVDQSSSDPKCRSRQYYPTTTLAISHSKSCAELQGVKNITCSMTSISQIDCEGLWKNDTKPSISGQLFREKNPNFDPSQKKELVPVSDTELGDKVNNSPQAPQIIPDVYNPNNPAGGKAPESTSDALDNAPPVPDSDPTGETKPKPNVDTDGDGIPDKYDPTKPSVGDELTLPEFCSWAVTICEWYVKYKEDSKKNDEHREKEKTFWQKIEDSYNDSKTKIKTAYDEVKEYFTKDRDKDDDQLDIQAPDTPHIDTDIAFGGSCPPDKTASINLGLGTIKMDFTYSHICTVASDIRGIVIFCGFFIGALIIGGVKQ